MFGAGGAAANEVRGTATHGSLWGLAVGPGKLPLRGGDEMKFVWRMTGTGPLHVVFSAPDGRPRPLVFGPEPHTGASTYRRPGDEWGTGLSFATRGCWHVHLTRADTTADVWLDVAAPPKFRPAPPLARAIDVKRATLFGFAPGGNVNPDDVLKSVTSVLGAPTRDTGWYTTHRFVNPDGSEDCLGGITQRVLRWGNVSYAFWHYNVYVLWSWTVGDESAEGDGDRREPHPIVEVPAFAPTTDGGIGLGTPVAVLRERFPKHFFVFDNGKGANLWAVTVSLANGVVSGVQGRMGFC